MQWEIDLWRSAAARGERRHDTMIGSAPSRRKAAGRRATRRERVRVEARRRLYRPAPGCEVLRESEAAKERVLMAGLSGYLASLFALTGKGPAECAERAMITVGTTRFPGLPTL